MAKMEILIDLAAQLKAAYDAQTVAEMHRGRAMQLQSILRRKILEELGDREGQLFLTLLREQSGYPEFPVSFDSETDRDLRRA